MMFLGLQYVSVLATTFREDVESKFHQAEGAIEDTAKRAPHALRELERDAQRELEPIVPKVQQAATRLEEIVTPVLSKFVAEVKEIPPQVVGTMTRLAYEASGEIKDVAPEVVNGAKTAVRAVSHGVKEGKAALEEIIPVASAYQRIHWMVFVMGDALLIFFMIMMYKYRVYNVKPQMTKESLSDGFAHSLFPCLPCADWSTFVQSFTLYCPFRVVDTSITAGQVDRSSSLFAVFCFPLFLLAAPCRRAALREKLGGKANGFFCGASLRDIAAWVFCSFCAVYQEARAVDNAVGVKTKLCCSLEHTLEDANLVGAPVIPWAAKQYAQESFDAKSESTTDTYGNSDEWSESDPLLEECRSV